MYYPDLTPYEYAFKTEYNVVNVGWLSKDHEFPTGDVSELFLDNLQKFMIKDRHNIMRGYHHCEVCNDEVFHTIKYNDVLIHLGNGEVWIPDVSKELIYAAPTLLLHHITEHNYLPPSNFIKSCEEFNFESDWTASAVINIEMKKMIPMSNIDCSNKDVYYVN